MKQGDRETHSVSLNLHIHTDNGIFLFLVNDDVCTVWTESSSQI